MARRRRQEREETSVREQRFLAKSSKREQQWRVQGRTRGGEFKGKFKCEREASEQEGEKRVRGERSQVEEVALPSQGERVEEEEAVTVKVKK